MLAIATGVPSLLFQRFTRIGMALQFTGCSLGGVFLPLFLRMTLDTFGYTGAMILLGGLYLQLLVCVAPYGHWHNLLSRWKRNENQRAPIYKGQKEVDQQNDNNKNPHGPCGKCADSAVFSLVGGYYRFFKTPKVPLVVLITGLGIFAYFNQFIALPPFALEIGLTNNQVAILVAIANIMEIPSRLIVGVILDRDWATENTIVIFTGLLLGVAGILMSMIGKLTVDPWYICLVYSSLLGLFGSLAPIYLMSSIRRLGRHLVGYAGGLAPVLLGLSTFIGPAIMGESILD